MRIARLLFTKAQQARYHAVWFVYCRPTGRRGGIVGSCEPDGDIEIEQALGLRVVCRWCRRPISLPKRSSSLADTPPPPG